MPIEQVANALRFLAFYAASGEGAEGLSVTVRIYNPAGTLIVTDEACEEMGDGFYYYDLPANLVTAVGEYPARFATGDTTVDSKHVAALWVVGRAGIEYLDASIAAVKVKTDLIAPGTVTVVYPLIASDRLRIEQGDDYAGADIEWTSESWPDLTDAEVTFTLSDGFSKAMTVQTAGGGTQAIRLALTAAETAARRPGAHTFEIDAVLDGGSTKSLVRGTCIVHKDV